MRAAICALGGLLAWVLAGCTPPVAQYELRDQQLTCDDANRFAYKTLRAMGFTITEFEPATYGLGGKIRGERRRGRDDGGRQEVSVKIECSAAGATLDAKDVDTWIDQIDFKRGFHGSFTNVVTVTRADEEMQAKIAAGTAPNSQQRHDLQVVVEPVRGQAAKLYFGLDLAAAGVLPVRINVVNHTERAYSLEPDDIRIRRRDRERVGPLATSAAARLVAGARDPESGEPLTALSEAAVADKLANELFSVRRLAPGAQAMGFLYFPLADYGGMRILFVDVATQEPEGVLVAF